MPYKRKKPFFQRHQAALVNILTVLVFGTIIFVATCILPDAIEQLQIERVNQ